MKVLIVDDDKGCLDINVELAEPYCGEIITAVDGFQGFTKFVEAEERGEPFDLVISDYQMPGNNGEEMVKAIRQTKSGSKISIMLMSGDCSQVRDVKLFDHMVSKDSFETYKAILEEVSALCHKEAMIGNKLDTGGCNLTLETYEKTLDNFGRPKK